MLRPIEGKTYADVLGLARKSVQPESCGAEIKAIRRTRAGEVLLELRNTSAEGRGALSAALKAAVGEGGSVRELIPRASLEIRDLDCCTSAADVEGALRGQLQEYRGQIRVVVTKPSPRGSCAAIVELEEDAASALLKTARLRIGWVNCRVRRRVVVRRCFRCLGFGHHGRDCKGPDRTDACYKCGTKGHRAANCVANPVCFLCEADANPEKRKHISGSGACPAFRAALSKAG